MSRKNIEPPRDLNELLNRPYRIEILPDRYEDGGVCFIARHPELPGCMSHGDTPEEAIASLSDARELYIRSLLADGLPVPEPEATMEGSVGEEVPLLRAEIRRLKARIEELEHAAVGS